MNPTERQQLLTVWEAEHQSTMQLLATLPEGQYDFRPDPGARSLGELAWHLAEGEGYLSQAVALGGFDPASMKLPELARPKAIAGLAPGFAEVHRRAVERIAEASAEQLAASIAFPDGTSYPVSTILWSFMLFANIHHRGQLVTLVRLAGGTTPPLYGPTRETLPLRRAS